jgi:molybdenum cofactor cytidylyltransferase
MEELDPLASGALLMTCDQPHLAVLHLQTLIRIFLEYGGAQIIASSYAGIVGTPAVFPASADPDLYALYGDKGARSLLAECTPSLVSVPFKHGEIDIDLPADRTLLE